jgi:DNA processing protein
LDERERLAWLRLWRSETIGPVTFGHLLKHFSDARAALDALPGIAERAGRRIRIASQDDAEAESEALAELGGRFILSADEDFPPWLRHAEGGPPLLAAIGDATVLTRPMVAIVGSREASAAGRAMAARLAEGIGRGGYAIASGIARGIDAAAHVASLATGTVAVFAGGLDRLYPPQNLELARRIIASGGAHVSEQPLGLTPRAKEFPRRNRIVSGLSLATIVIEGAERSGSLITARLAGEQGRLVFAVPGSPLDPRAAGTNRLLKEGAQLCTEADDVLSALAPLAGPTPHPPALPLAETRAAPPSPEADDAAMRAVVEALGPTPVEVDYLVRLIGLDSASVHLALMELDLAGRLEWHAGQRVSLVG